MKAKVFLLHLVLLLSALAFSMQRPAQAQAADSTECRIKVIFVYNFLKFVVGGRFGPGDEKEQPPADPNGALVVGVLGRTPCNEGFLELHGKPAKDTRIKVRLFPGWADLSESGEALPEQHPQMADLRQCHLLFVGPSERPFLGKILPPLQKDGILLVGDSPGFLEAGGMINFLLEEKKVRFEINLAAMRRAKLQSRSSLLRLAVRIIEHDQLEGQEDEQEQPDGRKSRS